MKVVVAIDSFKGSMSSMEAGMAAKEGILKAKSADVIVKPLADGGEGTVEALVEGMGGKYEYAQVSGPLGHPVTARYGITGNGKTAVMEMAEAAGITLVKREDLNPWKATTFGVGQLICHAIDQGCRDFIIGIGGSATTDGGAGMLQAFGYEFKDCEGKSIGLGIGELDKIASIDDVNVKPELKTCRFTIACDVKNPLCGENGAVYIYGPQKGVKEDEKEILDAKMKHFAQKTGDFFGKDFSSVEGAGAAGGLGFAFLSYITEENRSLKPGIEMVMEATYLEQDIKDCDIVITGEGRLDMQTAMGKVPVGVAGLGKKYGKKVIAFAGGVTDDAVKCNEKGIDAFFPIVRGVTSLEDAMKKETARRNMTLAVEQVFRLL